MSKSKLLDYLKCPRQFKYRWIDGMKGEPTPEMLRGKYIHEVSAKFYEHLDEDYLSELEGKEVEIEEYFREIFEDLSNGEEEEIYDNFASFETERWLNCWDGLVSKGFEHKVFDYFSPELCEYKIANAERNMDGIVDRVYRSLYEEFIIVEIKTGKMPSNLTNLRKELGIYTFLLHSSGDWNHRINYWGAYYCGENEVWMEEVNQRSLKYTLKQVEDVRRRVRKEEFYKKISGVCRYCSFIDDCLFGEM